MPADEAVAVKHAGWDPSASQHPGVQGTYPIPHVTSRPREAIRPSASRPEVFLKESNHVFIADFLRLSSSLDADPPCQWQR